MDLINSPLDALPGIDVPLLDITPYLWHDTGKFADFPLSAGFAVERISDEAESVEDLAAFLQS
jgi:hypothetical protein